MDFDDFFDALHNTRKTARSKRVAPFPWQSRLAARVVSDGWGDGTVLDLPTGTGKTAALDVAVYHLIRQAMDETDQRSAPLRIFYVVDRRIVVDATFRRARRIAAKLREPDHDVLERAAAALRSRFGLADDEDPLLAAIMRGGMFRDDSWVRSPAQPTICVSTVDQVGSRLLFRGYGVTPSMRPVHAGLVGNDSLFLIDEAHLSEPFLQTLRGVQRCGGEKWADRSVGRPITVVRMSATSLRASDECPPGSSRAVFQLGDADREHELLKPRLEASRPAVLAKPVNVDKDDAALAASQFAVTAADAAIELSKGLESAEPPVVGIVLNRVRVARLVFEHIKNRASQDTDFAADMILLTGRIRPYDRDELLFRANVQGGRGWLRFIVAGRTEAPAKPLFVVATQTIEVGADLDFDGLVTEAAPIDSLRQRFGRLNRLGDRPHARAVILVRNADKSSNADDPVYGKALTVAWNWLDAIAENRGKKKVIDFGLETMAKQLALVDQDSMQLMLSPRLNAPVMLPTHVDLWCQTNPAPAADPDVAVFLHGPDSRPADVNIVWRADLLDDGEADLRTAGPALRRYVDTVSLIPPTSQEACPVPLHAVRAWLLGTSDLESVTDVEGGKAPEEGRRAWARTAGRHVLRWLGPDDSEVVLPTGIRPGDTIVVPCSYGACDCFGWNPPAEGERAGRRPVTDVAESCSRWGRGRAVLRVDARAARAWPWERASTSETGGEPAEASIAERIAALRKETVDRRPDDEELEGILRAIGRDGTLPLAVQRTAQEFARNPSTYSIESTRNYGWLLVRRKRLTIDQIIREVGGDEWDGQDVGTSFDDFTTAGDNGAFNAAKVSLRDHTGGVREVVMAFSGLSVCRIIWRMTSGSRSDGTISAKSTSASSIGSTATRSPGPPPRSCLQNPDSTAATVAKWNGPVRRRESQRDSGTRRFPRNWSIFAEARRLPRRVIPISSSS